MTDTTLRTYGERSRAEERATETDTSTCPDCADQLVHDRERGEIICDGCGLVVAEDEIDHGPEWRAFDHAESVEKSRVGAPTTKMMHDEGLSTNIGRENRDGYGKMLSPRQREKMQRLRTWDERFRTRSHRERNLKQALGEIDRMASALGIPDDVRETASVIYRRALADDLLLGRSIEGVATAALYAAARQAGTPRSIDELEAVSRIDEAEFTRTYRYIIRELQLEVEPAVPEQYLPRFASELGISDEAERHARALLAAAKEQGIHSGKSPVGLAAAAIYAGSLLCDQAVTQAEVSATTDISEVTIRNRYKELIEAYRAT